VKYCINPACQHRQNSDAALSCQGCGTDLLVGGRYRLLQPLRSLEGHYPTELFEVDDRGTPKVMKVLVQRRPEAIEMFEREALTLQSIQAPGIPRVELDGFFSVSLPDSTRPVYCLVMEKIDGETLEQWSARWGKLPQRLALNWLRQLIAILDLLHGNGCFHRDIKPSNIILQPDGQLALIDFGSVRNVTDTYLAKLKGGLAVTSVISGGYTPPEQIEGKALPQSDFFALGRTFVHLLTGQSPVDLPSNPKTGRLIWRDRAEQVSKPLADFIDELMAPLPRQRPQDTASIRRYLSRRGLWLHSILGMLRSPQMKYSLLGLLAFALLYRFSFPTQAQYYYDRGLEAYRQKEYERARHYYEQALEFHPTDPKIYNNLGLLCAKEFDWACAQENYQKALDLNPDNPFTQYNLGGLYDDSGNFEQAERLYRLASESPNPVTAHALSDLARMHILQGDTEAAIALSERGLKATDRPKVRAALYKNLGWAFWIENDYARAESHLRAAIAANPERSDSYCLLAQVLEAQGDRDPPLMYWQNCLKQNPRIQLDLLAWQTLARQRLNQARGDR
jgi:serine/threonine protein kinase